MTDLLSNPLVPVASEDDADATLTSLLPRLPAGATVVVCHVIEKAGGAPDKASVEQRERRAEEIFEYVRARCADAGVTVETRIDYGTNVAETVFAAADDEDATAIAFTPRGGSRWLAFLTGDVTLDLVTDTDRPVVVLPDEATEDDVETRFDADEDASKTDDDAKGTDDAGGAADAGENTKSAGGDGE